jgi:hypothetical protein
VGSKKGKNRNPQPTFLLKRGNKETHMERNFALAPQAPAAVRINNSDSDTRTNDAQNKSHVAVQQVAGFKLVN